MDYGESNPEGAVEEAVNHDESKKRRLSKGVLGVIIVVLLAALALEVLK